MVRKCENTQTESHGAHHRGQIITMGILAATQWYNELITKGGLTVNPTPSWEAIDFSNNVDEMECA
jgi:hypothetical protein